MQLQACRHVAHAAELEVIGVFGAWPAFDEPANQLLGMLVDTAQLLNVEFVAVFPTDAGETMWGVRLYKAARFPHESLPYRMVYGRRSPQPIHNPRGIRAMWRAALSGLA
jgi:hypothetical protein